MRRNIEFDVWCHFAIDLLSLSTVLFVFFLKAQIQDISTTNPNTSYLICHFIIPNIQP